MTEETHSGENIETVVGAYRKLRDIKDDIKKKHSKELEPINSKLQTIEIWLLETLNKIGANSVKTANGTAYKATINRTKVVDWPAALKFIQENSLWHMLEQRVSKSAVEEYVESEGKAPPGVEVNSEVRVNVRRS